MSTISKVFTVVNLVLAMFLLGTVAAILANSDDYKAQLDASVKELNKTKADMGAQLEEERGRLANAQDEVGRLKSRITILESDNGTLESERNTERSDNAQLRASVDGLNGSLQALQTQFADLQSQNQDLHNRNDQYRQTAADAEAAKLAAEEDRARLEGALARRDQDVAELERGIVALTQERDNLAAEREALAQLGVPVTELIGNTVPLIEGTVSEVGSGFVVLSVGENDGVRIGYPFDVYRRNDYIGRVIVDKVFPDNCTARIQLNNKDFAFRALDSATTRL